MSDSDDESDTMAIADFIFNVVCGNDETKMKGLLHWMSQMLAEPEKNPDKAILLIGPPGCGKNTFARLMERLLGETKVFSTCCPRSDVWGRFNYGMKDTLLVHITDPLPAMMYDRQFNLFISDSTLVIRGEQEDSYHRCLITSNVINFTTRPPRRSPRNVAGGERFHQIVCSGEKMADGAYWSRLHSILAKPDTICSIGTHLKHAPYTEALLHKTNLEAMAKILNQSGRTACARWPTR